MPSHSGLLAALEGSLLEHPDDVATRSALADALLEQNDPLLAARGEFIQTQLVLARPDLAAEQRLALQERERQLLDAHARDWLGELAPYLLDQEGLHPWRVERGQVYRHQFVRGWLDFVSVPVLEVDLARLLARAPAARLLTRLVVERDGYQPPGEYEPAPDIPEGSEYPSLHPLVNAPFLSNLRFFQVGETPDEADHSFNCNTTGEGVAALAARMPRIEELHLFAHGVELGELFALPNLTHLRILKVYHLHEHPFHFLAQNAAFGRLTHLLIHPGRFDWDDEPSFTMEEVEPLLTSPHLPSLTHLQLRVHDLGDDLCRALIRSGILKRLKWLDLQHGTVTDEGARALASCPDVRGLRLDLSDNALTEEGVAALEAAGVALVAEGQHRPDDEDWRYEADIE